MTAEIISAFAVICVAVIESLAAMERKKAKTVREKSERRAEARSRETMLAMQMMDASLELSLSTALAVEEHRLNGEMKSAREKARRAQEEYADFIRDVAAHQFSRI